MSKEFTISDYRRLKKISTLARAYKNGVSNAYMYRLRDKYSFKVIEIDGVQFVDFNTLPEQVKSHIKL